MTLIDRLRRAVAAHVPGSEINLARQKRTLERELRTQGYSRTHAVAEVARRFREAKHG